MNPDWKEGGVCFLCDYWWVVLLILVLAVTAFFTRDYWLPLLG